MVANSTGTLYLLKRAQGSTGFAQDDTGGKQDWAKASDELYAQATTIVTEARAALQALGRTMPLRMVFSRIGEEDATVLLNVNAYAANLQSFTASTRTDWGYSWHSISRLHVE